MAELMQLSTEELKEAAQKLWKYLPLPTCDGTLIPEEIFGDYQNGKANGIEFIAGIAKNERQIYKSFIGQQNYEDLISYSVLELWEYLDAATAQTVKNCKLS